MAQPIHHRAGLALRRGTAVALLVLSAAGATAADKPPPLECTDPGGCKVVCYGAGAVDIQRSIVMQRTGVLRVEQLARGWLHVTVAEQAFGPQNYSGVMRLADTTTCWFARMTPAR